MALAKCRECGNQVSTEALFCPHCGAPQKQSPPPLASVIGAQHPPHQQQQTGRTESVVVQVAPEYENQKIQEMQLFGWNLQGRQEIEQQGQAYGRPSYLAEFTGTYVIKTTVYRFVKLHFVRSLNLPNLDRVR